MYLKYLIISGLYIFTIVTQMRAVQKDKTLTTIYMKGNLYHKDNFKLLE